MAINKVVYDGKVLIDLTTDTVTADTLAKGVLAHAADGTTITGVSTKDSTTTDATAKVAEILSGKTAYVNKQKLTGTMPNNGKKVLKINSWPDETYSLTNGPQVTIPLGYHDGSGYAQIDEQFLGGLSASNIKQGIKILGITGTLTGEEDLNIGATTVMSSLSEDKTITAASLGYDYISSITIKKIPYNETSNAAGGTTVTIGE